MNKKVYKKDFDESIQRLTDWWEGKKTDRPIARITAPLYTKKNFKLINKVPDKYLDFDTVFHNLDVQLSGTYFAGEAFPYHRPFGWLLYCQTLFGSEPEFGTDTIWYHKCHTLDTLAEYEVDFEGKWWRFIKEMLEKSRERSGDSYLVSLMSVGAAIDMIAGLIGNENTLMAMGIDPGKVKQARDRINSYGKKTYEETQAITASKYGGTIDGFGLWSPGRIRVSQCDLSVMVSTQMFDEFVRPDLEATYSEVDYAIYHLDGEEQIRHLDVLLDMDSIDVIQWVPSRRFDNSSERDPTNWIELFKKIQEAGKSVQVSCPPEKAGELLKKIDREKLILSIGCRSKKQADDTLKLLERAGKSK